MSSGAWSSAISTASQQVTYYKDVAPIFAKHCEECHSAGGIGPFTLDDYAASSANHAAIAERTLGHTMPPWGAEPTDSCSPGRVFRDDNRLSTNEIDMLQAWSKAGAPMGDPKTATPVEKPQVLGLTNIQQTLTTNGYTMSATTDVLKCFVLDPQVATTKYISALQFVPGEKSIVHHALIFADPDRQSLARATTAGTPGQYDCFGGPKLDNTTMLAAWAPGGVPSEYPTDIGTPLAANSLVVVQVHYHVLPGKAPTFDKSHLDLKFHDAKPKYFAATRLLGNIQRQLTNGDGIIAGEGGEKKLLIAPGETAHEESWRFTMPAILQEGYLYGVGAHMHYVGVKEELHIHRATGNVTSTNPVDECLLSVPKWDFDWQRGYSYVSPDVASLPRLGAGDQVSIKCTYNNTTSNPKMTRLFREGGVTSPQMVTLGETTLDEMCLGAFVIVTPNTLSL